MPSCLGYFLRLQYYLQCSDSSPGYVVRTDVLMLQWQMAIDKQITKYITVLRHNLVAGIDSLKRLCPSDDLSIAANLSPESARI